MNERFWFFLDLARPARAARHGGRRGSLNSPRPGRSKAPGAGSLAAAAWLACADALLGEMAE